MNSVTARFGSNTLLSLTQVPTIPFTEYTFISSADSTLTPLTFGFRDDVGFFSIDDISAIPIPEPAVPMLAILGLLFLTHAVKRKSDQL